MSVSQIISQKLHSSISINTLDVIDESHLHKGHLNWSPDGETHFKITIISKDFDSMSKVQRHKLIYKILEKELREKIHALTIKTISLKESLSLNLKQ